ncbi:MAG: ABC transporter substrate-binding protein [Streptococcaceae bacterium]|jgi:peptide/nickel transport system substrate-binding protein|nr:ABC transporter substrate-binding protein [Streptococcaceae bacterium]
MKLRKYILAGLATLAFITLAGCGSNAAADEETPDTFIFAQTAGPVGLSPTFTNDSSSSQVFTFIYDTLFDQTNGEFIPRLATGFENPDENTWVINLREGVEFHDGTPFNSEAVKYTFELLTNPETAAPRASLLQPITSIETPDDYTVILKTKQPFGSMLAALSHPNAAIISPVASENQNLMEEPVGTGPFVFYSRADGRIVLHRNDNYWDGPVAIERAEFKVVPAMDTAISMLQTGQVNFLFGVTSDSIPRIQGIENVTFETREGSGVNYVVFNTNRGLAQDLLFRETFAKAIDTVSLVNALEGAAHGSNGFIGPHVFGYNEAIENFGINFDLEAARKAVVANGFDQEEISILTTNTPIYQRKAEIIQAQLTNAGFNVRIDTLEWATYLDVARNGEFDIALAAWGNLTQDGSELLFPRLHSENIGSSNQGHYHSPELDALIDASRQTIDQEKRLAILQEANEYVLTQLPVIPLFHGTVNMAMGSGLRNVTLNPNTLWNIHSASFE